MTEFGFIDHIRRRFADLPDQGFEGIGDDCAVLPLGGEALVFTSDLLTEGVHFLLHATSARELGGKSLAVNLSDVAAMGARPVATLLSIALPPDASGVWAEEFMEGYRELSARFGTPLVGGDTTRSESGVTINVTAIGRSPLTHLKRRRDARGYRYAQRAVGHPDAAYRPRAHKGDVLEVVILVALKVFFEKFLYKHAYDGYYRNNRRRAQIRIRKHKAPLPQKLNKTNKAAVTLRYPLLSYHKKRKPQDGFAPRRLPRQSIFSDALKA